MRIFYSKMFVLYGRFSSGINGWCPLATGFDSSSCCCVGREKRDVCSLGVNRFVGGGAVNNFCGAGKSSFIRWGGAAGNLNKIKHWRDEVRINLLTPQV